MNKLGLLPNSQQERLEILQGKLPRDPYEDMMLHFYSSGSYKNYLSSWVNDEIVVSKK